MVSLRYYYDRRWNRNRFKDFEIDVRKEGSIIIL